MNKSIKNIITEETFSYRYNQLTELKNELIKNWKDIELIELEETGLTKEGTNLDNILCESHVNYLRNEKNHIIGRELLSGKLAASIPYDVPIFLLFQYAGPAYLSGMDVTVHFAKVASGITEILQNIIMNKQIEGIETDIDVFKKKINGKMFGKFVLHNKNYRHFVLAGGSSLIKEYQNKDISNSLDSLTIFGPTRPKTLFLDDVEKTEIKKAVTQSIWTAFFDSGQLCALDKELIPVESNYELVKETAIEQTETISEMVPTTHYVDSILDKPAFEQGVKQLNYIINNPKKYKILSGGKISSARQYISPTLIESHDVDPEIEGFWPYAIINFGAKNNYEAIQKAKNDKKHGCYCFVWTEDTNKFYSIEKDLLGGHFGTVLKNGNILNHSIGQPYGAFKDSFLLRKRGQDGIIRNYKGNHFGSHIVTLG